MKTYLKQSQTWNLNRTWGINIFFSLGNMWTITFSLQLCVSLELLCLFKPRQARCVGITFPPALPSTAPDVRNSIYSCSSELAQMSHGQRDGHIPARIHQPILTCMIHEVHSCHSSDQCHCTWQITKWLFTIRGAYFVYIDFKRHKGSTVDFLSTSLWLIVSEQRLGRRIDQRWFGFKKNKN